VKPEEITIAVTVYNRRNYLKQAIASALKQTVPVRVIVVEDCGPDAGLRDFVLAEFGSRVEYIRNPERRGLFGNWNACLDYARTPWLSILHDDDYLAPEFVEALMELHRRIPGCGLYFGDTTVVDESGTPMVGWQPPALAGVGQPVTLQNALLYTPFPFPGHLFSVAAARALGGFRTTSLFCGDWEMWGNLIDSYSAAKSAVTVAFNRQHGGWDRGTNAVMRAGRLYPLSYVQQKRILHLLRRRGEKRTLDRSLFLALFPVPTQFLINQGWSLPPRILAYHVRLHALCQPQGVAYAVFQVAAQMFGAGFVRNVSRLRNWQRGLIRK
jgi:glycosyltransferase involved in cell wall biosynthesis